MARAVAVAFDVWLQDTLSNESSFGIALNYPQPMSAAEASQFLAQIAGEYPAIRDLSWVNPQGRVVAGSLPEAIGIGIGERDYFKEILAGQDRAVSDLLVGLVTGRHTFVIARAIRYADGTLRGVVVATADQSRLGEILMIQRAGGGAVVIFDRQGRLVYGYPEVELTWEERQHLPTRPALARTLAGEEVTASFVPPTGGQVRMAGLTPIKRIGWAAGASRLESEVAASSLRDLSRDAGLFLLVTLAAFLLALLLSRNITAPISRRRQHALAVARGGGSEKLAIAGPRELADLAHVLNYMAQEIRQREQRLRASEARYRTLAEAAHDMIFVIDREDRVEYVNADECNDSRPRGRRAH